MKHIKLFEAAVGNNNHGLMVKLIQDMKTLKMDGSRPDDDPEGYDNSVRVGFRHLGNWVHDEENAWDREEEGDMNWREDDDQMIWAQGEYKRYMEKFKEWAKHFPWFAQVELSIETGEKNWANFVITIK